MKRLFSFKKKESSEGTPEMSSNNNEEQQLDQEATQPESNEQIIPESTRSSSEEENDPVESLLPSSYNRSSLFSRDRNTFNTFSTNPTSTGSFASGGGNAKQQNSLRIDNIGKPLRVLSADRYNELSRVGTSTSIHSTSPSAVGSSSFGRRRRSDIEQQGGGVNAQSVGGGGGGGGGSSSNLSGQYVSGGIEVVEKELSYLNENLLGLIDQLNQSVLNVSKASILFIEFLDDTVPISNSVAGSITIQNNEHIRSIIKIALQFYDNYLRFEVYENSKNLLIKSLKEFLTRLNFKFSYNVNETIPFMKNFAIELDNESEDEEGMIAPNKEKIERIIELISNSNSTLISDQQGSFIAPIMRGLTKNSSVLSIMFGFPDPQTEHYDIINALFQTFPDVHFFVKKDFIKTCATKTKFSPPFKIPNKKKPEISISISSESGIKTSGTLGGFIQPIFKQTTDPSLMKYKGSKFAITCAHVLLSENQDYPNVSVPSSVLINAYKSALRDERDKYVKNSIEYDSYNEELIKSDGYELNLGQVVWGERVLIKNKISDIAIVKVNNGVKCENFLGEGVDIFNPSLKFKNLYIKKTIPTSDFNKHNKVFKIGANTKYTHGEINGIKMIYWLDGSLQTSEFIISSPEPNFANGGDSGALILNNLSNETGLGVLGMLHSYDGEMKQFGLFTPVEDILERLHQVTGIEWDFIY